MARDPIPTYVFAMVVARHEGRMLVVHERKHGGGWYLPAGRVEPGETLRDAAIRETLEESGVEVELEGLIRVEHTPHPKGTRFRFFFLARPVGDPSPRTEPNEHTLGAAWKTPDELSQMHLRGDEVLALAQAVASGTLKVGTLPTFEGAPWR